MAKKRGINNEFRHYFTKLVGGGCNAGVVYMVTDGREISRARDKKISELYLRRVVFSSVLPSLFGWSVSLLLGTIDCFAFAEQGLTGPFVASSPEFQHQQSFRTLFFFPCQWCKITTSISPTSKTFLLSLSSPHFTSISRKRVGAVRNKNKHFRSGEQLPVRDVPAC